ncbi:MULTISPECIES: DUF6316 family protein [Methylomonas]|uniref:DUF6316 domain-containing protein n=1 Tax=Methylomonas koyamae TaxID=702114 RepID=A0A177NIY2_9GAMM|nr:DUF6316 family protein [Methylomonas koyamae]OAI17802.1 hypothetical protein A1355_06900 [Methylomonas koyamae]
MFKTERIFPTRNPDTGATVWFFLTREGREGPFSSEGEARQKLEAFIDRQLNNPKRIPRTRFLRAI